MKLHYMLYLKKNQLNMSLILSSIKRLYSIRKRLFLLDSSFLHQDIVKHSTTSLKQHNLLTHTCNFHLRKALIKFPHSIVKNKQEYKNLILQKTLSHKIPFN